MTKRIIAASLIALGTGILFAGDTLAQSSSVTITGTSDRGRHHRGLETEIVSDGRGNSWFVTRNSSGRYTQITPGAWNTSPTPWAPRNQAPMYYGIQPSAPARLGPNGRPSSR